MVEVGGIEPPSERVTQCVLARRIPEHPQSRQVEMSSTVQSAPFPVGATRFLLLRDPVSRAEAELCLYSLDPRARVGRRPLNFLRISPSPVYLGNALGSFVGSRAADVSGITLIVHFRRKQATKRLVSL